MPAQGWYEDPKNPVALRWWDGNGWTQHTQRNLGEQTDISPPERLMEEPGFLFEGLQKPDPTKKMSGFSQLEQEDTGSPAENDGSFRGDSEMPLWMAVDQNESSEPKYIPDFIEDQSSAEEYDLESYRPTEATGRFTPPSQQPDVDNEENNSKTSNLQFSEEVPPWIRESIADQERNEKIFNTGSGQGFSNEQAERFMLSEDFENEEDEDEDDDWDDDDFDEESFERAIMEADNMVDAQRSKPEEKNVGVPMSWEEMASSTPYEDEDDFFSTDNKEEKVKKYIIWGSVAAGAILVAFIMFNIIFGNDNDKSDRAPAGDSNVPEGIVIAKFKDWSVFTNLPSGYAVRFPQTPTWEDSGGIQIFSSPAENPEIQILEQTIPRDVWNSLDREQKLEAIVNLLTMEFPGMQVLFPLDKWETSNLGGFPAQKTVIRDSDTNFSVFSTFANERLIVVKIAKPENTNERTEENQLMADTTKNETKFLESWEWITPP